MYDECPNFKKTSQKLVTNHDFQKNKMKVSEENFSNNDKSQH